MAKNANFCYFLAFLGVKTLLKFKYSVIKPLLNVTFNFELIGTIFSLIGIILFELQQKNKKITYIHYNLIEFFSYNSKTITSIGLKIIPINSKLNFTVRLSLITKVLGFNRALNLKKCKKNIKKQLFSLFFLLKTKKTDPK